MKNPTYSITNCQEDTTIFTKVHLKEIENLSRLNVFIVQSIEIHQRIPRISKYLSNKGRKLINFSEIFDIRFKKLLYNFHIILISLLNIKYFQTIKFVIINY